MSCPVKYRHLGDFPDYYAGRQKAPYLTIFVGGNHEASSHLWELYYGGWVAPNIYYLGAANVLQFGPLRIAGMSGIWKGFDYRKSHHERLPFNADDVKSFYHVREIDIRKLLLLQTQVDVGISHDWPRAIEKHGDSNWLFRKKPDFRHESQTGTLGNVAAEYVMDRLRPPYWFSAHLHVKFAALKQYGDDDAPAQSTSPSSEPLSQPLTNGNDHNPDEIDLDMDDEDEAAPTQAQASTAETTTPQPSSESNEVSEELRAQLPASFARPPPRENKIPGQPVPPGIINKEVRFLALDKCLPGRHFLQISEIQPFTAENTERSSGTHKLRYDPEWLAITRVFHEGLTFGDRSTQSPQDLGEDHYLSLIDTERVWIEENVVKAGKLDVPSNFEQTAPAYVPGTPEIVQERPEEYTNPQTAAFCEMLGLSNHWHATVEERRERMERGPPAPAHQGHRGGFRGGRGGRGRGRGRGRGNRGRW